MVKTPLGYGAKTLEYIAEGRNGAGTFGTMPTNPAFVWVGLIGDVNIGREEEIEEFEYLGPSSDNLGLINRRSRSVGSNIPFSFKYALQNWTLLQYITGSASGFAKDVDSLTLLEIIENGASTHYIKYTGCMLTGFKINIPKRGIATVDVTGIAADMADPTTSDPKGSGSHASEASTDPFRWKDITNLFMDANATPVTSIAHLVGDITIDITSDVELPADVDSTFITKAGGPIVKAKDMSVSLELKYVDTAFYTLVKNQTTQNLKFTLGGSTFTIKGLKFPKWAPSLKPREAIGEVVTAHLDQPSLTIA